MASFSSQYTELSGCRMVRLGAISALKTICVFSANSVEPPVSSPSLHAVIIPPSIMAAMRYMAEVDF